MDKLCWDLTKAADIISMKLVLRVSPNFWFHLLPTDAYTRTWTVNSISSLDGTCSLV